MSRIVGVVVVDESLHIEGMMGAFVVGAAVREGLADEGVEGFVIEVAYGGATLFAECNAFGQDRKSVV